MWEAPHLTSHDFDGDVLHDLQYRSQKYRRTKSPQTAALNTSPNSSSSVTSSLQASETAPTEIRDHPEFSTSPNPKYSSTHESRPQPTSPLVPIVIASVVPHQTDLWRTWLDRSAYPYRILSLADIPLAGLYPTLGIDRALAGLGVGQRLGFPCLTIDGGTALTFTGFSSSARTISEETCDRPSEAPEPTSAMGILIGGAILPGMGLQYRSLGQQTAQLSAVRSAFESNAAIRPFSATRWARETLGAIDSGIHRAIGAIAWDFITDWRRRYPAAIVAITGGDAIAIEVAVRQHVHERDGRLLSEYERTRTIIIPEAIIWGMIATLDAIAQKPHSPDMSGDGW